MKFKLLKGQHLQFTYKWYYLHTQLVFVFSVLGCCL